MMAIQHNALDRVASVLASDHQASSDFDLNPDITLPAGRVLRDAGVLMLIEERAEGPFVYLTKRASHLKHHPGQIAFPGGKTDPADADQIDTPCVKQTKKLVYPERMLRFWANLHPTKRLQDFR